MGRLLYVATPRAAAPWIPLAATSVLSFLVLGLMGLVPGPPWLRIIVGVLAGAVRGAQTLVQGSAVAERWGTRNYGSINGAFAAPITAVMALSPALGPLVATAVGGYASMALIMAAVALAAAASGSFSQRVSDAKRMLRAAVLHAPSGP